MLVLKLLYTLYVFFYHKYFKGILTVYYQEVYCKNQLTSCGGSSFLLPAFILASENEGFKFIILAIFFTLNSQNKQCKISQ